MAELVVRTERRRTPYFREKLGEELTLDMVWVPGGAFQMGSPDDDEDANNREKPQHPVTVSSFFLGRYPVTQAQWRFVAGLSQVNRKLEPDPSNFIGDRHPVERVSWYDAVEFCDRLSAYTGRPYQLPSEAEWEYACRAGTTTRYSFGENISPEVANYRESDTSRTTPVDHFGTANDFGLSGMHENVFEWCSDHWHDRYEEGLVPLDGSPWTSQDEGARRVIRGGSWSSGPRNSRSAVRNDFNPGSRNYVFGFRVACAAPRT